MKTSASACAPQVATTKNIPPTAPRSGSTPEATPVGRSRARPGTTHSERLARRRRSALRLGPICLGLFCLLIAGPSLAVTYVLYDVDFGQPHVPGFAPLEGAEPIPRYLVSEIGNGTPLVVEEEGLLQDQPLRMESSDGEGDQITFDLTDVPVGDYYTFEAWIRVEEAGTDGGVSILFDTPEVRTVNFRWDGDVGIFVPGEPAGLGSFTLGLPVFVQVAIDLDHDYWTVRLDGSQIHEGSFGGASSIQTVRVATPGAAPVPVTLAAVDDIVITTGREDACDRLGFGDLTLGDQWFEGETFQTDGVFVTVGPHYVNPGSCTGATTSGFAQVVNNGSACGAGKELNLNNVSLDFDFGDPAREIIIPYGFYGGTIDLSVNGDCMVATLPRDFNGVTLGGVAVTVWDFDNIPQGCGVIRLGGTVDQLSIGGEEFFLDNLSYCRDCDTDRRSAFEDQVVGTTFTVGDELISGGATHDFFPYYPAGASCIDPDDTGLATIQNLDEACVDGKELHLDDISTRIDFGADLNWMVIGYGENAGNVNLRINEDCRNLTNLSDVSGSVIGGVTVWAQDFGPAGQSCGQLYAVGRIWEFGIGGDDLVLDNIRACTEATSGLDDGTVPSAEPGVRLLASSPNPLRERTTVHFEAARSERVQLEVFDASGRKVRTLLGETVSAGRHEVDWDGRDEGGTHVPSGIYWARVEGGSGSLTHRLIVVR